MLPLLRNGCRGLVLMFSARRLLFLGASFLSNARPPVPDELPSLAIVVPARDEARSLPRSLHALGTIDYPMSRLSIVLVDDGSTDRTAELLRDWASADDSRVVVQLSSSRGKVGALEAGMAATSDAELIGVCDADLRPSRDCWRRLASHFSQDRVGAVSALLDPTNHARTAVSKYAAVESWVHQLVTALAKDRLALNPPTNGASVYRRSALADVGGFKSGVSGEDVTTSAALTSAGWTTRFERDAIVENEVAFGWRDYWRQHVRWARGVFDSPTVQRSQSRAPLAVRLEGVFAAAGYLDRLALLGVVAFSGRRQRFAKIPVAYAAMRALEVWVALGRGGVPPRRRPLYFLAVVAVVPVDFVATAAAVVAHVRRRPHGWDTAR